MGFILRPSEREGATDSWEPDRTLAEDVRQFGFYPDLRLWEPGDLVLVRLPPSATPDRLPKRLQKVLEHQANHSEGAREWQHAAVWCGDFLCEATPHDELWKWHRRGAVLVAPIEKYFQVCEIRVRRPTGADKDRRARIAFEALTHLENRYDWPTLIRLKARDLWRRLRGDETHAQPAPWERPQKRPPSPLRQLRIEGHAAYCSSLYGDALWSVLGRRVQCRNRDLLTPADLVESEEFFDVDMRWVRLPPKR